MHFKVLQVEQVDPQPSVASLHGIQSVPVVGIKLLVLEHAYYKKK